MRTLLALLLLFSTYVHSFCGDNEKQVSIAIGAVNKGGYGWLPYIYYDQNGQLTGIDVELLRQTLTKLNYQLRPSRLNLPESRVKFNFSCEYDYNAHIGSTYTEQRAQYYYFSAPYRSEVVYAHVLGSAKESQTGVLKLIKNGKVGVVNMNGFYGEEFERMKSKYVGKYLYHIEGAERRISMVAKGRVDFLVGDEFHIKTLSQLMNFNNINKVGEPLISTQVHFAFSKKHFNESFMQAFNIALNNTLATAQQKTP